MDKTAQIHAFVRAFTDWIVNVGVAISDRVDPEEARKSAETAVDAYIAIEETEE